jgi:phosphoglycerate kinase
MSPPRPSGRQKIAKFSLKPVADELAKLLGKTGRSSSNDCVGPRSRPPAPPHSRRGVLLENLRFHIEEEGKAKQADGTAPRSRPIPPRWKPPSAPASPSSATSMSTTPSAPPTARTARWSAWTCRRRPPVSSWKPNSRPSPRCSTNRSARCSPSSAAPRSPTRFPLINNLLDKADDIIIGGGMAFTFRKVLDGMEIGDSLFDAEGAKIVPELAAKGQSQGRQSHLPVDFVCGRQVRAGRQGFLRHR